jgi:hypothetical protein
MGGKWLQWNHMTDRLEFFFMRSRHIEGFERAWRERIFHGTCQNPDGKSAAIPIEALQQSRTEVA